MIKLKLCLKYLKTLIIRFFAYAIFGEEIFYNWWRHELPQYTGIAVFHGIISLGMAFLVSAHPSMWAIRCMRGQIIIFSIYVGSVLPFSLHFNSHIVRWTKLITVLLF